MATKEFGKKVWGVLTRGVKEILNLVICAVIGGLSLIMTGMALYACFLVLEIIFKSAKEIMESLKQFCETTPIIAVGILIVLGIWVCERFGLRKKILAIKNSSSTGRHYRSEKRREASKKDKK